MPAPAFKARHQKTFEWQTIDQFCQETKTAMSPGLVPNMAVGRRLAEEDKLRTVVATDQSGTVLHGAAAMVKMTDTDGYLCFYKTSPELGHRHVKVRPSQGDENCLQVVNVQTTAAVRRPFAGNFVQLHDTAEYRTLEGHMLDTLTTRTLGLMDFDRHKNVTIDVNNDDAARISVLRDDVGFSVTDSVQFVSVEVDKASLLSVCSQGTANREQIQKMDFGQSPMVDALVAFDKSIVGYDRREYLEFLGSKLNVQTYVHVEKADGSVDGCLCLNKDSIVYCYAIDDAVAKALLKCALDKATAAGGDGPLTLYTCRQQQLHHWLQNNANNGKYKELSTYRRLHTRCRPFQIQWNNVYAANIGWQLI